MISNHQGYMRAYIYIYFHPMNSKITVFPFTYVDDVRKAFNFITMLNHLVTSTTWSKLLT